MAFMGTIFSRITPVCALGSHLSVALGSHLCVGLGSHLRDSVRNFPARLRGQEVVGSLQRGGELRNRRGSVKVIQQSQSGGGDHRR